MASLSASLASIHSSIGPSDLRLSRVRFPERNETDPEHALSFLLDDRAVLVDDDLAAELGLKAETTFETNKGVLRVAGTFPNPSGEPLILMDIAHAQKDLWA